MADSGKYKRTKRSGVYVQNRAKGVVKFKAKVSNLDLGTFNTRYEAEVARDQYLINRCPNEYYYLTHPELFIEPDKLECDNCNNLLPRQLFNRLHTTAKYIARRFYCRSCLRLSRSEQHSQALLKGTDGPKYYEKSFRNFFRHNLVALRTKAKKRGLKFEITLEDLLNLLDQQMGLCALSGLKMAHEHNSTHSVSVDRKDSSAGYTLDNIQLVRREVNFMKREMSNKHFYLICKKIALYGRDAYKDVTEELYDKPSTFMRPSAGRDKRYKSLKAG